MIDNVENEFQKSMEEEMEEELLYNEAELSISCSCGGRMSAAGSEEFVETQAMNFYAAHLGCQNNVESNNCDCEDEPETCEYDWPVKDLDEDEEPEIDSEDDMYNWLEDLTSEPDEEDFDINSIQPCPDYKEEDNKTKINWLEILKSIPEVPMLEVEEYEFTNIRMM